MAGVNFIVFFFREFSGIYGDQMNRIRFTLDRLVPRNFQSGKISRIFCMDTLTGARDF